MSDLEVLKEIPGYKAILKSVLKSQIQLLMEQLSEHTGEESMILTASVHDGSLSHLGSNTGKGFLEGRDEIKSQFLGYCLKTYHKKKTHEPQKPYQRTHPSPRSPAQLPTPPAKRPRVHPVSLARASSQDIYPQPSEISGDGSDSNVGYGNIGAISDSNVLVKTEQYDSANQNSDITQHEQMAESNESVTFKAAEKSIPETVHLSHTQTSGAASEIAADMDSEQEKNETDITDLTSIKVEQVEDELEITGVEMAASNLDNWGQGQAGFGAESDSSFDQSTDQSGYNDKLQQSSSTGLKLPDKIRILSTHKLDTGEDLEMERHHKLKVDSQGKADTEFVTYGQLREILDGYVQKSEFKQLERRIEESSSFKETEQDLEEALKYKMKTPFVNEVQQELEEIIKHQKNAYMAVEAGMRHLFTIEEINMHSATGKKPNRSTPAKPKFDPWRYDLMATLVKKHFGISNKEIVLKTQTVKRKFARKDC